MRYGAAARGACNDRRGPTRTDPRLDSRCGRGCSPIVVAVEKGEPPPKDLPMSEPITSKPREGRALIDATRPFAKENRALSWWHVLSSAALWLAALAATVVLPHWGAKLAASVVAGLLTVRMFILYHDFLHSALLRGSALAKGLFYSFGVLVLTPPNVWRQTHNYHHAHTAKIVGSHVGSYPVVTVAMWRQLTSSQRLMYRVARHPVTILLGYVTIFLYGMCTASFLRNKRKNWDSALALVLHAALTAAVISFFGLEVWWWTMVLPLAIAFASGAYLFYAQHNFEGMHLQPRHEWTYTRAALESSSFMRLGPVMNFFTGSIGYHHVHHLNPTIPFYRLAETMAAIPELQSPGVTTLGLRDIVTGFRFNLWDPESGKMVRYADAPLDEMLKEKSAQPS